MKNILINQFIVLLIGTLFAWGNFGYEFYKWKCSNELVGCAIYTQNPFLTTCFYGAIFFTIAFILNIISIRKLNRKNK